MIIEWFENEEIETGFSEVTDLTDIDKAVAKVIGKALQTMVVTDTKRKTNSEFYRFTQKPMKEKLMIGQFDDVNTFVSTFAGSETPRNSIFPIVYLYRDSSIVFADGTDYKDIMYQAEIMDNNGNKTANIHKSFVKLTYTVTALAWEKSTSDRLGLNLAMWLRHMKNTERSFTAKTMIAGAAVELKGEINGQRDTMTSSVTMPYSETKLNGQSIMIEVTTETLEAIAVDVKKSRWQLAAPELMK